MNSEEEAVQQQVGNTMASGTTATAAPEQPTATAADAAAADAAAADAANGSAAPPPARATRSSGRKRHTDAVDTSVTRSSERVTRKRTKMAESSRSTANANGNGHGHGNGNAKEADQEPAVAEPERVPSSPGHYSA